jgi:hypothetical protein
MADRSHYQEYLGWNIWLYCGESFDALQLIYRDTSETDKRFNRAGGRNIRRRVLITFAEDTDTPFLY